MLDLWKYERPTGKLVMEAIVWPTEALTMLTIHSGNHKKMEEGFFENILLVFSCGDPIELAYCTQDVTVVGVIFLIKQPVNCIELLFNFSNSWSSWIYRNSVQSSRGGLLPTSFRQKTGIALFVELFSLNDRQIPQAIFYQTNWWKGFKNPLRKEVINEPIFC